MELEDIPVHLLTFPRIDYSLAPNAPPPSSNLTGRRDLALGEGARYASRTWATALRTGKRELIDHRCFTLAVLDKVIEFHCARRWWEYEYSKLKAPRPRRIWPNCLTVPQWCQMNESFIPIAYGLAVGAYPDISFFANPHALLPPPLDIVVPILTPLTHWLHLPGDSRSDYRHKRRPPINVMDALGPFYWPPVEETKVVPAR
ncbi:unnamed protein product [Cutaneotrichosporon oleaginosum]